MGLTFDTGALIALERRDLRMRKVLDTALAGRVAITVPTAVVAEWWRGRSARLDGMLAMFTIEDMTERLAKLAGEAMAAVTSATVVDAIVMASAASRGDPVYTSDVGDLARLRDGRFPTVRVLAVRNRDSHPDNPESGGRRRSGPRTAAGRYASELARCLLERRP